MGNSMCCPKSNPCDITVDETQGLLNSPDSKVSSRPITTDGICQSLEVEESSKNEAECIRHKQEQDVVTTQPIAAPKSAEEPAQSSYCSVIQSLHTEVSLTAQANQSASPVTKVIEEQVDAAATATETKKEDETTKESTTSATEITDVLEVKASIELATDEVKEETEAQITNTLENEEKTDEPMLLIQDAKEDVPTGELHDAQVDTQNKVAEDNTEKRPEEADENEDSAEMNRKKEAGEVDTENEELKTPVEVLPDMDILQTKEPVLNNSVINEVEEKGLLTPVDIREKSADTLLPEMSSAEPLVSLSQASCEAAKTALATEKSVADKLLENHDISNMSEMNTDILPPKTQETPEQESTPTVKISDESTVNNLENGEEDNLSSGDLKDENLADVDVEVPHLNERKPSEEPSYVENQELMSEPPATSKSGSISEEVEKPESTDTAEVKNTITEFITKEGDVEEEAIQNGLHKCAPVEKSEPTEKPGEQDIENEPETNATGPSDAFSLDHDLTEKMQPAPEASENDEITAGDEKENAESNQAQKGELTFTSSHDMKVALIPVSDIENIAEKEMEHEDEDLYRGDDEIEQEQAKEMRLMPIMEFTIPGVEEKCSLAAPVDILAYSEREWKGNTAKSNLIRKGYSEISCSFTGLRRVRGDNYCSLRATLYQVLATTPHTPAWLLEESFTSLPEIIEAQEHLIGMWVFPPKCVKAGEKEDAVEKLKHYLELLQKTWQAAAESETLEEKLGLCDHVFQGGEEEYALLEVLKFLMLVKAVELHKQMQAQQDVPVFCWLLFARDTSENPKMFFSNHLSQVGFSGGLEQVEMFLLGYALQHTIQAFRLYKTDTEEFVTHYPDDHKHDWPCVSVITEDDRHYNVPVRKPTQYRL
ncbi:uncharacterized protein YFR016C isoform X2 [Tachysurus fulvidraco]|uniref:uncharacterized protein YFR016C isoform X2 n=1 Tax=Tachysurus fulvidraco TaxID=1234273 RepID=UPI001FEDDB53|nr:uncharacterized protein YFR016C isoform X2 [Tachysurus fulvidraco]